MTIPRPTPLRNQRPAVRALAFGLVILGLCVFAWGLRYKLSLYDPPGAGSRHMPAAKLLTGKERRALPVVNIRPAAGSSALTFLAGLLLVAFTAKAIDLRPNSFSSLRLSALLAPVPARTPCAGIFIRPPPRVR